MEMGENQNEKNPSILEESSWIQSSLSLKEKAEKYISLHML